MTRLRFSADGATLRSISGTNGERGLLAWDVAAGRARDVGPGLQVADVSPDGRTALAYEPRDGGHGVVVLDLAAAGGPRVTSRWPGDAAGFAWLAGDGVHALTVRDETTVDLWTLATGQVVRPFVVGGPHRLYAAVLSPDGSLLAAAGWAGEVELFDAATGARVRTFTPHRHGVMGLAFSPDGALLASCAQDRSAAVISLKTGRVRRLPHRKEVFGLAFSPDGRRLATGDEAAVRVWDARTGEERARAPVASRAVAFAPDGRTLAAGTWGPVLLFDLAAWGA